jgi:hypothetical protein
MRIITNCLLTSLVISISLLSCQKEVKNDSPGTGGGTGTVVNPTPVQGTVTGKVIDNNNNAVAGATVKAGSNTTTTDSRGLFRFNNIQLDKYSAVIIVEKSGFFKGYRVFSASPNNTNFVKLELVPKTLIGSVDAVAGGALMSREPLEAMTLIDSMAQNQQWSGRDNSRPRGGGRFEVDQMTAMTAKMDAMQKAMDRLSVKAVEQQPQACVMCGDENHAYEQCPMVQTEEETEQVHSLNNEPSFFPKPPFNRSYSKDPVEQQNWRWNQSNAQRPPFNNNFSNPSSNNSWNNPSSSGNNNRNFYQNASFPNQGSRATQAGPTRPYVPPYANNFTHEQGKMNQMMWEQMQSMSTQMAAQNKLLEQLSQMVTTGQPQPGKLPSQPEPNPRGEAKAITLRSGTQYDEPAFPTDQTSPDVTSTPDMRPASEGADREKKKEAERPPPYRPPVPFPRRLAETKLNAQFAKFTEVLKGLQITIPFTEALTQMPTYAKFLKDILSNKRSLGRQETVKLTEQCSAILRSELPPKLEDPGKFSIPCTIGKATIKKALCDLGASVSLMPRTIYERIGVGELKPTRMTLQLADSSVRLPLGIVEDLPVQVGKYFVPVDFVVMEMEEDKEVPIILGRPFLRTAGAIIDVRQGTLTLNFGGEKVKFQIERAMKYQNR